MRVVYDVETLAGTFTYTALDIDTKDIYQYVIHPKLNQLDELIIHLNKCKTQIGFNNISFDYPIIHLILSNYDNWKWNLQSEYIGINDIITEIYDKAQTLIQEQHHSKFGGSFGIKHKDIKIPQLDLFKIWHFNNAARSTSLKSLQIAMNYHNVQDMEISHTRKNISKKELNEILEYNLNDVNSTYEFFKKSKGKLQLRKLISQKYNLNVMNYPDSKIGESLMLKMYCDKTGLDKRDVKDMRTKRESIALKDCIFEYIKFKTPEFNKMLNTLKNKVITETKGAIKESVIFQGFKYDYGTGGIHGCIKPGVYNSDDKWIIIDADVGSMYPSIAIVNELYPEHLGIEFCELYEGIVQQRLAAKKSGDTVMADGLKLSANSVYGKSNDEHSFLQDPLYTMRTTLTGQLTLSMLCEKLSLTFPDSIMLQVNTDGFTMKIRKTDLDRYYKICSMWENITKLNLEYVEYSKMVIRDVNNYLSVTTLGKIKYKGAFEIDKDYHKDNSFRIIPLALSEYFINNIPVEETIKNHTNIYDFCGRQKFNKSAYGVIFKLDEESNKIVKIKQPKNVRYYMSEKGYKMIKRFDDGRESIINEGLRLTVFNKYYDVDSFEDYGINYQYYIKQCNKEIGNIENNQLKLF